MRGCHGHVVVVAIHRLDLLCYQCDIHRVKIADGQAHSLNLGCISVAAIDAGCECDDDLLAGRAVCCCHDLNPLIDWPLIDCRSTGTNIRCPDKATQ